MPGESGFELVRQALCDYPEMAAVFMTGNGDLDIAGEALDFGAYDFIAKPIERERLVIGVRNALQRRRQTLEARSENMRLERMVADRTAALAEISIHRGRLYDPTAVDACLKAFEKQPGILD